MRFAPRGTLVHSLCLLTAGVWGPVHLLAQAKLEVVQTTLHQYDGGPPLAADYDFYPGDTVFLTFRVAGFALKEKGDEESLQLTYRVEAFDPAALRLKEEESGRLSGEMTAEDKKAKWTPLAQYEVLAPPAAPSGTYRIAITVRDEVAGTTATKDVSFQVRGRNVASSDELTVRNFRFLRSETDTRPLTTAAYKPGDVVWARFDITGYKFGEGNRFSIDYGLTVLRDSGKELYREEVAAQEERASFYPERYIPGSLSLSLTKDLATGPYTILLTVRDHVGEQTFETKQQFQVE
ncbi:MAG: hypothetical protein KIT09_18610 [Bryobacteraceae bacterium]|nr:hypothetical protein [Bryobacteraceae bacterium]